MTCGPTAPEWMPIGIEAVFPNPNLSLSGGGHNVYPYLLREVGGHESMNGSLLALQ